MKTNIYFQTFTNIQKRHLVYLLISRGFSCHLIFTGHLNINIWLSRPQKIFSIKNNKWLIINNSKTICCSSCIGKSGQYREQPVHVEGSDQDWEKTWAREYKYVTQSHSSVHCHLKQCVWNIGYPKRQDLGLIPWKLFFSTRAKFIR